MTETFVFKFKPHEIFHLFRKTAFLEINNDSLLVFQFKPEFKFNTKVDKTKSKAKFILCFKL